MHRRMARSVLVCVVFLLLCSAWGQTALARKSEGVNSNKTHDSRVNDDPDYDCYADADDGDVVIGFGSCNHPYRPQYAWKHLIESPHHRRPHLWLWTGDAVYTNKSTLAALKEAYQHQLRVPDYQRFLDMLARAPPPSSPQDAVSSHRGMKCFARTSHHDRQQQPGATKDRGDPSNVDDQRHSQQTSAPLPYPLFAVYDDHDFGINDVGCGCESCLCSDVCWRCPAQQQANDRKQTSANTELSGINFVSDDLDPSASQRDDIISSRRMHDKAMRMKLLHDFAGVPDEDATRSRDGVYRSILIHSRDRGASTSSPRSLAQVIMLDTRTHRLTYPLPNLGVLSYVPLLGRTFTKIGTVLRGVSAWLGMSNDTPGAVLGDTQWRWLERQLAASKAKTIILISSIQVFTTNTLVESWAHFPTDQRRLLKLMRRHADRGFLVISGDVHFAEFSSLEPSESAPSPSSPTSSLPVPDNVIEVTSSGMTHDCNNNIPFGGCKVVLNHFNQHRAWPGAFEAMYNYGVLTLDAKSRPEETAALGLNIYNAKTGHPSSSLHLKRAARWQTPMPEADSSIPSAISHGSAVTLHWAIVLAVIALGLRVSYLIGAKAMRKWGSSFRRVLLQRCIPATQATDVASAKRD